jgi:inward rectifier potassium channel
MGEEPRLTPAEQAPDLGLGKVAPSQTRGRLLEKDGSFNVVRRGDSFWSSANLYNHLLNLGWPAFLSWAALGYLGLNLVFAAIYTGLDLQFAALVGEGPATGFHRFLRAFYFSVQTSSTIGYGHISPHGDVANLVVTVESFFGLLGLALVTGLVFARFSRPTAHILFSEHALIAPYQGRGRGFMFRIVNGRKSQLIGLSVQVILSWWDEVSGSGGRSFHFLKLERESIPFFFLNWTIVHPIEDDSPLHGVSAEDLLRREAEFTVLLTGMDETFSQTVHARSSYRAAEVIEGARFVRMFKVSDDGRTEIDLRRLDEHEPAELP